MKHIREKVLSQQSDTYCHAKTATDKNWKQLDMNKRYNNK